MRMYKSRLQCHYIYLNYIRSSYIIGMASICNDCEKAFKKAIVHLQQIVKMENLMPELDKCNILTESDLEKINAFYSNYNKVAYLGEVLPQRSEDWWDHLLTSLKASEDIQLKLAARILEIEYHSVRLTFVCINYYYVVTRPSLNSAVKFIKLTSHTVMMSCKVIPFVARFSNIHSNIINISDKAI